jgi:hypothetical protein
MVVTEVRWENDTFKNIATLTLKSVITQDESYEMSEICVP